MIITNSNIQLCNKIDKLENIINELKYTINSYNTKTVINCKFSGLIFWILGPNKSLRKCKWNFTRK